MQTRPVVLLIGLLVLSTLAAPSWSQQPVVRKEPYRRRPSPSLTYLNLFRNRVGGGGGGRAGTAVFNYYTLVRPELELRRQADAQAGQIFQLGGDLQSLEQNQNPSGQAVLRATGHQSHFMNFSHFYPGFQQR